MFPVTSMGGQKSKPAVPATAPVTAQPVVGGGRVKGGGKDIGKKRVNKDSKFQVKLSGEFNDYGPEEDSILKRAYLVGHPNCKFHLRGQNYEYNFRGMQQKNLGTAKSRDIRPPVGMRPPSQPLLPPGPMTVITVKPGQAGTTVEIPDPNQKGKKMQVNVPSGAKPGQKMAVPMPDKGESVSDVQKKQKSYSTGAKIAMGTAGVAAVGGLAVGGVILGDHLTGGTLGVADAAADAAHVVADGVTDAYETVADWAPGAAEATGDWVEGAAEDVGDWLGDAADDTGDFIMNLF